MGFTTEFKKASTSATISAVVKLSTYTQLSGSSQDVAKTANVEMRILTMKFIEQK